MVDLVKTAIGAAKTPLVQVALPLVIGAVVVAVVTVFLKK
jgi:hypothetical protein